VERVRDLPEQVHTLIVPELNIGRVVHEVERAAAGRKKVLSLPKLGGTLHTPGEILEAIERGKR
jgi:2-oxoglutarate ferredoxin oxidoreductase subunit alpha